MRFFCWQLNGAGSRTKRRRNDPINENEIKEKRATHRPLVRTCPPSFLCVCVCVCKFRVLFSLRIFPSREKRQKMAKNVKKNGVNSAPVVFVDMRYACADRPPRTKPKKGRAKKKKPGTPKLGKPLRPFRRCCRHFVGRRLNSNGRKQAKFDQKEFICIL